MSYSIILVRNKIILKIIIIIAIKLISQLKFFKVSGNVLHHIKDNPSAAIAKSYEKRIDWHRIYHKYRRSNLKKISIILDELCDLTGMNRKYLIRKLNKKKTKILKRRGAKPIYEPEIYLPIIKPIWSDSSELGEIKEY